MVLKKKIEGLEQPKDLWKENVPSITMKQFAKETADVEKIIWFGESSSGKTRAYLDVLGYLKQQGVPAEKVCMCVIFSDRATGITKLYNLIPKEYVERVHIFPTNDYESMVKATASSEQILMEHFKNTGVHGWLICELLAESWRFCQDHYSREAFGETLADLMSAKRRAIVDIKGLKDDKKKESAYQALEGWRDWSCIKFYHNFNWIDRIKKMPFNVGATAEIKDEANPDSIFAAIKVRPSGEKDNVHRFDTIIYKKHQGDKFYMRCLKLTGYDRLYTDVDITNKNSYAVHKEILKKFDKAGYHSSAIEELEKEAGIPSPPKVQPAPAPIPTPPPTPEPKPKEEAKVESKEPEPVEKPEKEEAKVEKPKEESVPPKKVESTKPKEEKKEEKEEEVNWDF